VVTGQPLVAAHYPGFRRKCNRISGLEAKRVQTWLWSAIADSHLPLTPGSDRVNGFAGKVRPFIHWREPAMLTFVAIVCPPLAVLGTGSRSGAVKNLGLTALLYIPGLLHALRRVDDYTTQRRFAAMLRAMGLEAA